MKQNSKKLNSFILPDKVINQMTEQILLSAKLKKETGFNLCAKVNNELDSESFCIGSDCYIVRQTICKKGRYVGGFHTHIDSNPKPSIQDIKNIYEDGLGCIGTILDKKIRCFLRKNKLFIPEEFKIIEEEQEKTSFGKLLKPGSKELEIYDKSREKLQKRFLKTVEIQKRLKPS